MLPLIFVIGKSAVRIGLAPKRAILFRTDAPFAKLTAKFVAPNGNRHQIEVLGDGQQVVFNGIHPDTKQPYRWHGGEPGPNLKRDDLPLLTAEMATEFVATVTKLMTGRGWKLDEGRKGKGNGAGTGADTETKAGIRERAYATAALDNLAEELAVTKEPGRNNRLYKSAFRLGTMAARGWLTREEIEAALYGAAMACGLVDDDGEAQTRRSIESGLADVHRVFKFWFGENYDTDVIDATAATAAAERLAGDPLWLLIISGPGNTKTETVQSLSGTGAHIISTISSEGALLSASPRKSRVKTATGGLLRKIGDRGVLIIKDVTSILSADPEPAFSPRCAKFMTDYGSAMLAPMADKACVGLGASPWSAPSPPPGMRHTPWCR